MSTSGASTQLGVSHGGGAWHAVQSSDEGRDAGRAALADGLGTDGLGTPLGPTITFASTEHFNLQIARAITVSLYERHHRRALVAYSPEAIDRAAISVSPSQPADAA